MSVRVADVVNQAVQHGKANGNATESISDGAAASSSSATPTPRMPSHELPQQRVAHFRTPPTTPSMRTGPPRSLSYSYSTPNSPAASRSNSKHETNENTVNEQGEFPFLSPPSDFRDAFENRNGMVDRKGKKRESKIIDESWNPLKWFHDSPKEEKDGFNFDDRPSAPHSTDLNHTDSEEVSKLPPSGLKRASSVPHSSTDRKSNGTAKWGRLRSLIPNVHSKSPVTPGPSAVTSQAVNITDELITGGLSTLMLRLWFERDEYDQRRIPLLFHRLRIRVSDSLHPLHGHKSVFRIECEYANGAARWVVYRQLRDFISLHYHYSLSNAYRRNVEKMPEFPKTSLPYFKFLQKEGREKGNQVGHADFARLQREAMENYLLDLIRAVMFHPAANRLAGFLEISALSMYLSHSGGAQYKAGYLQIEPMDKKSGFGRKGAGWRAKHESRWCALRESYLVALEEPGELNVWDCFLLDSDFKIERPKRYYRQGLNLLHGDTASHEEEPNGHANGVDTFEDGERMSLIGSIKGKFSRAFRRNQSEHFPSSASNGAPALPRASSSSSSSSVSSRAPTAMLDPSTNMNPLAAPDHPEDPANAEQPWADKKKKRKNEHDVSKHTFYISNSQMRLKLYARNERQMLQWITAFQRVAASSHYTGTNRFDSFSPIRLNVAAQWLVDGRDYFWNLSRAIMLARETIYIHDWWLSPELQLRRPNKDRYRLDHLLERKAKEGVKIFIIVYKEVSSRTTPTDSNYTKQRMSSLHPNIMVQRSPSHFQTGTFYWAHHEKLCVIDQAIAFMGGLDLCFGRWDTPQHVLTDDQEDTEGSEIWPGKDYSNARVQDFHTLSKPEEDMYDRTKVPRMPWHDVGMQVVGQPARDLARHFVQRWNYLLRIKTWGVDSDGLDGTCEMQICRSAGPWSLGTPDRIEHSIQNAYLKAIQMSEHFVYIENQFFITSTVVNDVKVENKIGDALVHRIIRAHRDRTPWKCCIVIPLLPGFAFLLTMVMAVRLRKEGIDPDDYISVFSLRNWGKLRDVLTTEQVYIHGKVCIVDDRLAIIGSANINERSQRGDRDSELAAVIRDTDMIDCTMAGKPFKVGRFAHTLRVRLMKEHAGIDVDASYEDDLMAHDPAKPEDEQEPWDPDAEQKYGVESGITKVKHSHQTATASLLRTGLEGLEQVVYGSQEAGSRTGGKVLNKLHVDREATADVGDKTLHEERTTFTREGDKRSVEEQLSASEDGLESHPELQDSESEAGAVIHPAMAHPPSLGHRMAIFSARPLTRRGVDDSTEEERAAPRARSTIRRQLASKLGSKTWTVTAKRPHVDPDAFEDPVSDSFWKEVWVACAVYNTEVFRKVFHAVPDDLVTTWKQYKEFVLHHERLNKPPRDSSTPEAVGRVPSETGDETVPSDTGENLAEHLEDSVHPNEDATTDPDMNSSTPGLEKEPSRSRSRATRGVEPFTKAERDEMEKLLGELCGHLVLYPTRFLEGEDVANNFLFNADRLMPLPIYD
ncbi:hypothetical protein CPB85DRAFT_1453067 [Mucidula mucida]|nr:hypothetical protein CPB85DRAFT_1453067 [Mucidula mucida]